MTISFRARRVYIGKKMHPPISWGRLINVMVHPTPRHPALLLYGCYTCVEPRRLKVLTPESVMVPIRCDSEEVYT